MRAPISSAGGEIACDAEPMGGLWTILMARVAPLSLSENTFSLAAKGSKNDV